MTKIKFELDGQQVEANAGETIWQVAKRHQKEIPHLCYSPEPDYRPDGNCRACMVEIEGERVLAASCKRTPSIGMKVKSESARAVLARWLEALTFMPLAGLRMQLAASTRSPSISTMQARQLPSGR